MPIYLYRCTRCEQEHEELQRHYDDPPPVIDCTAGAVHEDGGRDACELERVLTTAHHKFAGEHSSDGIGGWQRQGDTLLRTHRGVQANNYGDSSTGKE